MTSNSLRGGAGGAGAAGGAAAEKSGAPAPGGAAGGVEGAVVVADGADALDDARPPLSPPCVMRRNAVNPTASRSKVAITANFTGDVADMIVNTPLVMAAFAAAAFPTAATVAAPTLAGALSTACAKIAAVNADSVASTPRAPRTLRIFPSPRCTRCRTDPSDAPSPPRAPPT